VPIDRAATLRTAEKLLRQGKLEPAIAEYLRITKEQPRDWNTANIVGDLYVRAGKIDKAIEQFVGIADTLNDDGFLPKASAVYKKVLKLKPEHEHALLRCAEIAAAQGVLVDARTFLGAVGDRRRARGDKRGAAEIGVRLGSLDPNDYPARVRGARARLELDDRAGALGDLQDIALELLEKERPEEAFEAVREAMPLADEDQVARGRLLVILVKAGHLSDARMYATRASELQTIASELEALGQADEALHLLQEAVALDPDDERLRARVAARQPQVMVEPPSPETVVLEPVAQELSPVFGELTGLAQGFVVPVEPPLDERAPAGFEGEVELARVTFDDHWAEAERLVREGRVDEGRIRLQGLIHRDATRRQDVALLGLGLAHTDPDAAFHLVDLAADAAIAANDWESAAAGFQELVTRATSHLPSLMRLVEISVDGQLTATMYSAQAQLADAYLDVGAAQEAHFIAEDLVAREPWERAHLERCRRALVMLGETDPDGVIARRLSGETPFTSTDAAVAASRRGAFDDVALTERSPAGVPSEPRGVSGVDAESPLVSESVGPQDVEAAPVFEVVQTGEFDQAQDARSPWDVTFAEEPDQAGESEVDLSVALDELRPAAGMVLVEETPAERTDLEKLLQQFRRDPARREEMTAAERDFEAGLELYAEGDIHAGIDCLTKASSSPRLRFVTAALLARIHRDQGLNAHALVWFEQAFQAPPPSAEEGRALQYEFGELLEATGAHSRALEMFSELRAEAPDFRDVSVRVTRLTPAAVRG